MSNAKPLDLSLPYQVADISLADFGKKEMQLSEREMPGLMELIRRYGDKKPLKGFKIMGSLHMTIQTAMLIKTLYVLQHLLHAGSRRRRHRGARLRQGVRMEGRNA